MALSIPATIAVCVFPVAQAAWQWAGLFLIALLPGLTGVLYPGVRRETPLTRAHALFSCLAFAGAFTVLMTARANAAQLGDTWTFALFAIAELSLYAMLWSAGRLHGSEDRKPDLPVFAVGLTGMVPLAILATFAFVENSFSDLSISAPVVCALYGGALVPSFAVNVMQARRDRRLPVEKGDRRPDHISGVGATALIVFAIVIVTLGLWAAAAGKTAEIDGMAGLIVIFGLATAFILVAIGPFLPVAGTLKTVAEGLRMLVKPLGALFSWSDSLLVFAVAGTLGATQKYWTRRYVLLIGNILPCAILGWWLKEPYGLLPLVLSILGAISIARRWAWIEEDRENAMLNRQFVGPHIRVGFGQDLRDETLIAFMTLLFLVPLVLRQLHMAGGGQIFEIATGASADNYLAWLSFFGTELAKALPFVDWAEVYHVEGHALISLNDEKITAGNHIIFATRILVDLVLLAAFLQAISIAQRSSKLRNMFYTDRTIDQLDPFSEGIALRGLLTSVDGNLQLIESEVDKFPRYNEDRLEELRNGHDDDLKFVARKLLKRYSDTGSEERLLEELKRSKPDFEAIQFYIAELNDADEVDVGPLKAARFRLNDKPAQWPTRRSITQLIAMQAMRSPNDVGAINALAEILYSPFPNNMDTRGEVRLEAARGLEAAARDENKTALDALRMAAELDPKNSVKDCAQDILSRLGQPRAI
jgi:hypothetical protein